MKSATVQQLKTELKERSKDELLELILRLSKFKKENKELLTYLLFEADNEEAFVQELKAEISEEFGQINKKNYFYVKKSVRKILRICKKYIRYSDRPQTEIELLIHFCQHLQSLDPPYHKNIALLNLYDRQLKSLDKALKGLHEDLRFDYQEEIEELHETPS